jgi:signal transduction histidine kinase
MTAATIDTPDPDWTRAGSTPADYRLDAIVAGVLLLGTAASTVLYSDAGLYPDPAPLWLIAIYVVLISAPLAVRRRWPEAVAIVLSLVFAASQILRVPELLFCNITLFAAIYSVGAWGGNRLRARVVRALIVLGMFAWLFGALVSRAGSAGAGFAAIGLIQILTNLLYFGAAWFFGDRAWRDARARASLENRTRELAEQRELNSHRAVTQERLRIARDLHDVVAHHVSVIGVQAGAARRILDSNRDQVVASLQSIEANSRMAVIELQRMLGTLRDEDASTSSSETTSVSGPTTLGIPQLEHLVAETGKSGLAVRFSTVGEQRDVASTTGMIVYRIAQEALTNTLKHAGVTSTADVRLRYLTASVEIEISDSGGSTHSRQAAGAGLGHVGIRERVDAVGGTVQIGPTARGGYLVRATLPSADDKAGAVGADRPTSVSVRR